MNVDSVWFAMLQELRPDIVKILYVILGGFIGVFGVERAKRVKEKKEIKGYLLLLTTEQVRDFERIVMLYTWLYPSKSGQAMLTKTTVFEATDESMLRDLAPLVEEELFNSIVYIKERIFHLKKKLDEGSQIISSIDPRLVFSNKASYEAIMIKAENYQKTAVAFVSDAPGCFINHREDESFKKFEECIRHLIRETKK